MSAYAAKMAPWRGFDLPWTTESDERRRSRRILTVALLVALPLAAVLPFIPLPQRPAHVIAEVPERLARLVEARLPPPPPPPPPAEVETPQPEPVAETAPAEEPETKPRPRTTAPVSPTPAPRPDARRTAASAGVLKFQSQLAALRDSQAIEKASAVQSLTGKVSEATQVERSLVTSNVGRGSGGINTSNLSRGYGAGTGALEGHATTRIGPVAGVSSGGAAGSPARQDGGTASRSREEIELVFDRNKSAIYALYSRALRTNPALKGKVVLELTISPDGQVTDCRVVSSDLDDPDLERRLLARVKMFRFEARDVATVTTTKPIDFFPA